MKIQVLLIVILASIGFGCQKEKSAEELSNKFAACKNEYTGGCKLTKIVYEPISTSGVQQVIDLTYTGNQITLAEDVKDQRKIKYNTDGKISSIEYIDKSSSFLYAIEKMTYNSLKQLTGILILYNAGNNRFDSLYRIDLQYSLTNQLTRKAYFDYDDLAKTWKSNENYLYTYDNMGLVTLVNYTNPTANPPTYPISINYTDSCNSFQKVYPQLELLDYIGQEDLGGFSVLLNSKKLISSFLNQNVIYSFNSKNAPTEIRVNGLLRVSYIYTCP